MIDKPHIIPTKSDEEIRQLAKDLIADKIFTNGHCSSVEDIRMVFMVIGLSPEPIPDNTGMIYEYLDKAGPRSCNGMPIFFSVQFLHAGDTRKLGKLVDKMNEALNNV